MALSLLPLNALAAGGSETDGGSGMIFTKKLVSDTPDEKGNYTIQMTAQATGKEVETTKPVPMDIVLVLDQSGSMADDFNGKTTYKDEARRQYAMKEAVISFIDEVADKNADHRMAIVTFSDDAETLAGWTAVDKDGEATLISKISGLTDTPSGATNVEAGMAETQSLMSNAPTGENRQKTVIVFTDGVPTTSSDFDTKVANNAISAAKDMKADDVTIYTVGIFNGADPAQLHGNKWEYLLYKDVPCNGEPESYWGGSWAADLFGINDFASIDVPAGNRFLNYLSSNSDDASEIGITKGKYDPRNTHVKGYGWRIDKNADCTTNKGYYKTAVDASSLKNIFKVFSNIVPEPDNADLNKDTVITDTLSNYFTFAGTEEDVKVYAKKGNEKTDITNKVTVNPNPQTKTVTVTDYDFSKHHTESDDPEELVIEIKVKPSGDGCTSKEIPTNDDPIHAARVEVEVESEGETETKIVTSHKTAKVTGYKVIYDLDGCTGDMTGDDLYYPQGAAVPVTDSVPTLEGYEFTGWTPSTDDTNVTAPAITGGKFTMPAANVILTAQWREIEAPEPNPATVTLRETDANGNALIKKHLTITAKEAETIKDAYFCVAVTAADDTTKAAFNTEPRYATTTKVKDMTRTSDGTAVEGSFVFPKESVLTFTKEGTYTFTVKEVFDEYIKVNHTTYDDTVYTMIVKVEKDESENKLNATVSFKNGDDPVNEGYITFNNTYKTPVIPTYTFDLSNLNTIKVNKEFVSRYGRSATMSFEATATIEKKEAYIITDSGINTNASNSAAAAKSDYTKVVEAAGIVTLKTGKTGVFQFSGTYDLKPGNYRITVKETKGSDRYYVTYDDTTYTYDFTVNNEGKINIDTPITCTFTNVYTKRHSVATPSKPTLNTGDHYAYVMGYPDGTVRPNGSITRAEVSAILFRLLSDKTRDEYFTTVSSFTDVKAGAWYNNSIATLEKAGVIVDTAKGGAFRPNEAITRAELAAMLAQFSDAKPVKGVKFSDVSAGHWAYEAIAIAAKMGWIEGYPDGTFRPDATITRAEMMTLVNRALERVPSDEDHLLSKRVMLTFPDCKSGDWFYIAVQEATNSHTYERAATEKNGDEQWTALRANRDWTLLEK